ncbi:MAG: hypothetical protein COA78_30290 [Blastopirellula sp.]|nr:MAG: hypothetical protein COA78_30290 [Blastopirellula sp.]
MKSVFSLFAQRGADSPANQWLNDNPLVLGGIAILLGLALAGYGLFELKRGVAHDKYGNEMRGGLGKFSSIIRVVFGCAAILFGLYKMVAG